MSCLQNIGISWLKQVMRKIALQGFHHKDSTRRGRFLMYIVWDQFSWRRMDGFLHSGTVMR